jgi:tetratricopeptide (TPR) repeat protein
MPLPDLQEPLTLLEQKDVDAAVEVLERKATALPAHLGAHVLLACAYEAQKRWNRALEAWATAQFLMPNSPIAEAGKRRVLRRMDGIEDDDERSSVAEALPPLPAPTASTSGAPSESEAGAPPESDEEESSSPDDDFGLAQLRQQAEREARQGGARPGLADDPESPSAHPSPKESSSPPEEQVEHLDEEDGDDDLDDLIDKLQSAQIDPGPDAETETPPPVPDDPEERSTDEPPGEEVVSETLAKIHEGQNDYERAAHIYAQLAEQEPDRADEFRQKAAEMREKADGLDENP